MQVLIFIVITAAVAVLASCGESAGDAYERGFDDGFDAGWADTCNRIRRFDAGVEARLGSAGIC